MTKKTYGVGGKSARRKSLQIIVPVLLIVYTFMMYCFSVSLGFMKIAPYGVVLVLFTSVCLYQWAVKKEKISGSWATGAKGEETVHNLLEQLDENYYLLNDLSIDGKWNIDHVVVAPSGIFIIETKNFKQGKIELRNGSLIINGNPDTKGLLFQTRTEALSLKNYLTKISLGKKYFIKPILVFTNSFIEINTFPNKRNIVDVNKVEVKVMNIEWLLGELTKGKECFDKLERSRITAALQPLTSEEREKRNNKL